MRACFNRLYIWSGYLAGLFLISTLLCVLASVISRLLPNVSWQGMDAYAGYSMAASSFLALASTLRHGEHIRVTLILNRLTGRAQRALDLFCHLFAIFLSGVLAWFSLRLVYQSYTFNDISTGLDATPLWIPQTGMALGCVLLCLAYLGDCITLMRGEAIIHEKHDAAAAFTE